MSMMSTTTKGRVGLKAVRAAARRPRMVKRGVKMALPAGRIGLLASKPFVRRRARQRAGQFQDVAHKLGEVMTVYGPQAAYELGLAERPKPKRTAPRVAAGVAIGAGAAYLINR